MPLAVAVLARVVDHADTSRPPSHQPCGHLDCVCAPTQPAHLKGNRLIRPWSDNRAAGPHAPASE
jgi:hypothetical protein